MNINVIVITHKDQRYPTVGDWEFDEWGNLQIRISFLGGDIISQKQMSCLVIHELIEAILCRFSYPEVTTQMVDEFDMSHPESDDPGNLPDAPYHKQHRKAEMHEFQLTSTLGLDWFEYDKKVKSL
jgi:hypothetical protein